MTTLLKVAAVCFDFGRTISRLQWSTTYVVFWYFS